MTFEDYNQILNTVNDLFINTDRRDWVGVEDCFADEVLFDMTSMAGGEPITMTPQQITTAWDDGLKNLKAIHHQVGNYKVTCEGDQADVFCYGTATHYYPNPTNQNVRTFVGSYDFHLLKIDGVWKIDQFKFNLKYIDGNTELEKQM